MKMYVAMFLLMPLLALAAGSSDGKSLANTTGSYYRGNMNTAINKPMTANTNMKTVDGSKSFANANVSCAQAGTQPYFRLDSTVVGGGEISLSSYVDRDLDGTFDANGIVWTSSGSQISSRTVSGVCFNGVVSCNSGTWDACKYYRWQWSGSALMLAEADVRDVLSCQCSNNSCGGNAYTQGAGLLDMLATGASTKITENNSKYTISKVDRGVNTIVYWGQDYSTCNNNGMSPNSYSGSLENKGAMAQQDASLNTDSAAYTLMNSQSAKESSPAQKLNYFGTNNFGSSTIDDETSSKIMTRQKTIGESTQGSPNSNGYTMGYTDTYVNKNGDVITESRGATIQVDDAKMIKLCTVYWYAKTPDVFADGTNRSTSNVTDEVKNFQTRECIEDGAVCPVQAGEAIDKNCAEGSQKDLLGVAARLQGIQEAANDMICSTK